MVYILNKMSSLAMLVTFFSIASGTHFTPAYLAHSVNPYNAMNIYFTKAELDIGGGASDLVSGDEIGLFDGTVCVGFGVVSGTITNSNILEIKVSAQDSDWPVGTGFTAGNSISIHYWDASEEIETFPATATYQLCSDDTPPSVAGCGTYSPLGSAYMTLSARSCAYSNKETCWDGSCAATKSDCPAQGVSGCMTSTACNYNADATIDDGSCVSVDGVCDTCVSGVIVDNDADNDGTCNSAETTGCMDNHSCNYNAAAEFDDGTCATACDTCTTDGTLIPNGALDGVCNLCVNGLIVDNDANDDGNCDLSTGNMGSNIPTGFTITNIYPNPFNPITTINYGMHENAAVKILIYNIVGEEIATLVNTYQTAGNHSVIWNADMQSGGMYLVKMIAGRHINTKKLMLIKQKLPKLYRHNPSHFMRCMC